jgi:hypothetical protein
MKSVLLSAVCGLAIAAAMISAITKGVDYSLNPKNSPPAPEGAYSRTETLLELYPYDELRGRVRRCMEDGKLTAWEFSGIQTLVNELYELEQEQYRNLNDLQAHNRLTARFTPKQ